jgi:ADP-heptose:LPS heptosyltransferase
MKVVSFNTSFSIGEIKIIQNKQHIITEKFLEEFKMIYGNQMINSIVDFSNYEKPYRGQDLNGKTLFCFRGAGIGDLMAMMVGVRILKEKYPESLINVGSMLSYKQLFENDPSVNEFSQMPYPLELVMEADYTVSFQGIIESNYSASHVHMYDLFLHKFGFNPDEIPNEMKIPKVFPDENDKSIKEFIQENSNGMLTAGIQLEASNIIRNYHPELILELIKRLISNDIKPFLIGEPHKVKGIIENFRLTAEDFAVDLLPYCNTLNGLISAINNCDFLIGPDSSGLHIAGALGKPMVGVFGPILSDLRLRYFKNTIGIDCSTVCSPCFLHMDRPCKNADKNGYSLCMNLATPELIMNEIKKNIWPLFGYTEGIVIEQPEKPKDEKRAIVTVVIGKEAEKENKVAIKSLVNYGIKVDAEVVLITKELIKSVPPHLQKFQMKELLNKFDRILYVDADILIHPNCPDLFEIVPADHVGAVPDCHNGKWGNINRFNEAIAAQDKLGNANWQSGYFNSGVIVFSKEHKDLFGNPELRKDFDSQFRDQTLINYNLFKNNYKFFPLETRFNGMEINGFSSRIENSNKTNAFIMHFAHEGDKAEQMRKVVEELEANNEDPIL